MAISDILSTSADEIKSCLDNQPGVYAPIVSQISQLLVDMERIRVLLDTPPYNDPTGPRASLHEALCAAINAKLEI